MSKLVKLQIYEHKPEEVVIDTFEAKEWGDFLLIRVKGYLEESFVEHLREVVGDYSEKNPEKQVVIVPEDIDLTFYGIERDDE